MGIRSLETVTVYILYLKDHTHYTGMTNNISRRMSEHKSGHCDYTSRRLPFKIIYTKEFNDRKSARRHEVYIKSQGAARFLRRLRFCSEYLTNKEHIFGMRIVDM